MENPGGSLKPVSSMSWNVMLRRPFESTLGTLVGVMDHCGGSSLPQRHVQCFQHQLGAQMSRHRPADDPAAEGVEHHREIQESCPGRDVGDVSHPQAIRSGCDEVAIDQIGCRTRVAISDRGGYPLAPAHAGQACCPHQSRHSLATHLDSSSRQFGVDARHTVGSARALMNRAHPQTQFRVRSGARRRWPLTPRVIPAGGDFQHSAHRRNLVHGLIRAHEFERRDCTEPVSVANQAAAFDSISRSSRNTRFSRRSRASSCRSSLLSPSSRRPASRSACATQLRIDCAVGSNSFARSSGLRPARTSSTIRCRYSDAYLA
jgi:hypothetical protein